MIGKKIMTIEVVSDKSDKKINNEKRAILRSQDLDIKQLEFYSTSWKAQCNRSDGGSSKWQLAKPLGGNVQRTKNISNFWISEWISERIRRSDIVQAPIYHLYLSSCYSSNEIFDGI